MKRALWVKVALVFCAFRGCASDPDLQSDLGRSDGPNMPLDGPIKPQGDGPLGDSGTGAFVVQISQGAVKVGTKSYLSSSAVSLAWPANNADHS